MSEVQKRLRQTVIDHDPKTGAVVGATKLFEQWLVDVDGNDVDKLSTSVSEDVKVADVPKIWNGTTDEHVAKLGETENTLAAERAEWAEEKVALEAAIAERDSQIGLLQDQLVALTTKLTTIGQHVLAIGKTLA